MGREFIVTSLEDMCSLMCDNYILDEEIGMERLQQALRFRNMKQKELAERIGVNEVTLSRYVKGTRTPNADVIIRMCKELNVSADWLLGLM